MAFLDSTAGASVGPTKRRILLIFMRYRLRSQPARLVRGSSRRIMAMRSQPANIRVINRRASSSAGTGSAIQTGHAPSSPTGTCSRYAARRRLLEVPERCSQARVRFAAPKPGAPLLAALRSGPRLTRRAAPTGTLRRRASKRKGRLSPHGGKPA
jgi:hypothetical protein